MVDFKLFAFNNNFQVCKLFRSALLVQLLQHFCRTEKTDSARVPIKSFLFLLFIFSIFFFFCKEVEKQETTDNFVGKIGSTQTVRSYKQNILKKEKEKAGTSRSKQRKYIQKKSKNNPKFGRVKMKTKSFSISKSETQRMHYHRKVKIICYNENQELMNFYPNANKF